MEDELTEDGMYASDGVYGDEVDEPITAPRASPTYRPRKERKERKKDTKRRPTEYASTFYGHRCCCWRSVVCCLHSHMLMAAVLLVVLLLLPSKYFGCGRAADCLLRAVLLLQMHAVHL